MTNSTDMQLVTFTCDCGNELTIQSIAVKLGLVDSCGHCNRDYPREQHEKALQTSVIELGDDIYDLA